MKTGTTLALLVVFLHAVSGSHLLKNEGEYNREGLSSHPSGTAVKPLTPNRFKVSRLKRHEPRSHLRLPRSEQGPSPTEVEVARLAQQVSGLSASVLALTNDVHELRRDKSQLQDDVSTLQALHSALDAKMAQCDQTTQQQGAQILALSAQLSVVQAQVDQHSQAQNASVLQLNNAVTDLQTKLVSVDLAQNVTSSRLEDQMTQVDALDHRTTLVEDRTTRQEAVTDSLSVWRGNVTSDVKQNTLRHVQLMTEVDHVDEQVRQLSSESSSLTTQVSQLSSGWFTLKTDVSHLSSESSTLTTQVSQLSSDWSTLNTNVSHLSSDWSRLDTDVAGLSAGLASSALSVAFYARLIADSPWPNNGTPFPILMDETMTNQGQAYNLTTGNFTVPVDGDYLMAVSIGLMGGSFPIVEMMVEDNIVFQTDRDQLAFQGPLHLLAGQRVWLRSSYRSQFSEGMYFSGVLITPVLPPN